MNKKTLTEAYSEINQHLNLDYLNIDSSIADFDWDLFFKRYHENLVYEMYEPETFQITKDEIQKNNRRHIEYSFDIKGNKFRGIVDIVTCDSEIEGLNSDIVKFQMKKVSTNLIETLKQAYIENPNKFVIKYRFVDSDDNTFITNKMGNKAFLVLRSATKCLLDAISKLGFDNLLCLEFHVAKSEIKRLDLYKKLIQNSNLSFDNSLQDSVSDPKYITYYMWRNF
jgi:hypothetical protein